REEFFKEEAELESRVSAKAAPIAKNSLTKGILGTLFGSKKDEEEGDSTVTDVATGVIGGSIFGWLLGKGKNLLGKLPGLGRLAGKAGVAGALGTGLLAKGILSKGAAIGKSGLPALGKLFSKIPKPGIAGAIAYGPGAYRTLFNNE